MEADEPAVAKTTTKVAQKQILTPGLVQMVTVLQLNRLELKEMINQEIVKNPVLEEATEEPGEEVTPEELLPLLEQEQERITDPADQEILDSAVLNEASAWTARRSTWPSTASVFPDAEETAAAARSPKPEAAPPTRSRRRPPPTRSTKSISVRFSTIISIPATRARLRNRWRSPPSRRSFPRR